MPAAVNRDKGKKRQCSRCGQWLPRDTDHFHRNKSEKLGFSRWCIECKRLSDRKRSQKKEPVSSGGPRVIVIEDEDGNQRALRHYEWYAGQPNPPEGWRVVGEGSSLMSLSDDRCTLHNLVLRNTETP